MNATDAILLAARKQLHEGTTALELPAFDRGAACSDDLWVDGARFLVRASLRPGDGASRWIVDLQDSSPASDRVALGLDPELVRFAAVAAFSDALGLEHADARLRGALALLTDDSTWVGRAPAGDACARLFGAARVFDAIRGALALAWPTRARAASCSLGAIVIAGQDADALVDVVPGGRGASVDEPGTSAWPGPLLAAGPLRPRDGITPDHAARPESGGGAARHAGDGVIARYRFDSPTRVRVALDRITNPPHGLDRAGPPLCGELLRIDRAGDAHPLAPWQHHTLGAGETLEVRTAGGAGHGFPGWGIDFDWE